MVNRRRPRRHEVLRFSIGVALAVGLAAPGPAEAGPRPSATQDGLVLSEKDHPQRTVVSDSSGRWVATFTHGASTVTIAGSQRVLDEATAAAPVVTTTWVRVLPVPYDGAVDRVWLAAARTDTSPDVLATAMGYVAGAPEVRDPGGALLSSDAAYGPLQPDGSRQEGSDWNDYLGIEATYGSTVDPPEPSQVGALDCSGYVRMVWGRRHGLPLTLAPDGRGLPRRAVQIEEAGPGVVTTANRGVQVTSFNRLAAGDLVFFDAASDDGAAVDHVGMYLGRDTSGRHRFVSSRKSIDGPTMGDYRGMSVLDGSGLYASAFRSVRRV